MKSTHAAIDHEHWDLVIEPKVGLLDLKLKELWRYRDLLKLWVRREYVGAYKQTILGPLWHFISPVFSTFIYMFLFGKIAKLSTDEIPMFLFYNAGLAIWNFYSGCYSSASGVFTSNAGIFGKVYFPRLIMPLASVVSNFIKFGIQFSLFIVAFLYFVYVKGYHPDLGWGLLLIPFCLVLVAGIGFGLGVIVSSVTTKYRDISMFIGFAMSMLIYATPVVYSFSNISPEIKSYLVYNPLVAPVECFKYALFGKGEFSIGSVSYSFACMILLMLSGVVLFNKAEKNFMDNV